MKVLDKDRHNLSNAEVLDWINRSQARYERQGRQEKLPSNFTQISKQVKDYLERRDGPLEDTEQNIKARHKPSTLELTRKLKAEPYLLYKGEILMILNHRPRNRDVLATLIEEADSRFPEEGGGLDAMLQLIDEHIGPVGDPAEAHRLKAQFERDKLSGADRAVSRPNLAASGGATGAKDGDLVPLESLPAAEAASLPGEDEMDAVYEDEEAALWALKEREAKVNKEGEKDIEDSPLTKWMQQLKLREQQQR